MTQYSPTEATEIMSCVKPLQPITGNGGVVMSCQNDMGVSYREPAPVQAQAIYQPAAQFSLG